MRRALNVLQACHAAYDRVDEAAVYNCTGSPFPADIEAIVKSMMSDEFTTAYQCKLPHKRAYILQPLTLVYTLRLHLYFPSDASTMKVQKGMALADMVSGIYDFLMTLKLPPSSRVYLLDQLGQIEHRLSTGGSERIQLTALLGAVKMSVELAAAANKNNSNGSS